MTEHPLEPFEPEIDALLDRERAAAPPAAALDRLWSRVTHSVAASHDPAVSTKEGDAAGRLSPSGKALVLAALGIGGVLGAGLHALLRPPPGERVVYVERAKPPIAPATSSSSTPVPSLLASAPQVAPPALSSGVPRRPPAADAPAVSSLLAERETLDRARSALAQWDGARALALVDEHTRMFPRPQLAEEREALGVQALVIAGRYAEARARGAQFRATWPSSLFLPAVDATLDSIP
jgi:hypothetical protein